MRLRFRSSITCCVAMKSCMPCRTAPCLQLHSSPRIPGPTPPSPFPPSYTAVRRHRGDTRLPLGTSCAPPPHEVHALPQPPVGFLQVEAFRLQRAVFLKPAVDAGEAFMADLAIGAPSLWRRLEITGGQHSHDSLHLHRGAHRLAHPLAF